MSAQSTLSFSIVIPTYNRQELLRGLLESLENIYIPINTNFEILVVDNNSTDQTKEMVDEFIKKKTFLLRYIFEKEQGASHARNRGIKEAIGQIVAFLDDDEIVDKYWLAALREGFDRLQCEGIAGRVIPKWTFPPPSWYTTEGQFRIVGPTAGHYLGESNMAYTSKSRMPVTGNLAIKNDCFKKHGYFLTDMGPVGDEYFTGEDTEFCLRLIKRGARLFYVPKAIVHNLVHTERVTKDYCKRYYFRIGRSQAMLLDHTGKTRTLIGIPIYFFRDCLETLISWISAALSDKKQAAFYYRLKLNRISGQIYQLFINSVRNDIKKKCNTNYINL